MKPWIALLIIAAALVPSAGAAQSEPIGVAPPFQAFYSERQGARILGAPIGYLQTADSRYAQYFEKGLLEDHRGESSNPSWQLMYARLAADLLASGWDAPVGGDTSDLTYASLQSRAGALEPAPRPGVDGPVETERGVFIPYNAQLAAGDGHYVAPRFWAYINRADLFPGGWLHDVGLPISEAVDAQVSKDGARHTIQVQAFERAILTFDAQNPPAWQVERDNIGVDHRYLFEPGVDDNAIATAISGGEVSAPDYSLQIERVEGELARARLYPLTVVTDPAWVWLRRTGAEWSVFGGPGTAFDQPFYDQNGVPALLRLGNPMETALYQELDAWIPANTQIGAYVLWRMRIEAGVATVVVATPDTNGVQARAYARLVDIDRWQVLGAAATFEPSWLTENAIPQVLW